jgi:TonB-linked SusC/RagA family outer membrane protein
LSIEITANDRRLTFSYIGMKDATVIVRGNKKSVMLDPVVMQDDGHLLNEVVVTGYQTLSRERATGAFDKIDNEALSARPSSDLSTALQGLVAGMQGTENEDGTVDFKIRGTSSFYANTSPLIVVDGFPIEGNFNSINPNDVESVTVLKDAAAASIWGTRSANGVIVITTKHAKANSKLTVQGKSFWRIGTRPDIDYILAQADSRATVDYELQTLENGWNFGDYVPGGVNGLLTPLDEVHEIYYNHMYNGLSEADMNQQLDELRNRSNRSQLKKYLMQQQLLQQYNVSISGGTDKFTNYASLLYEKNKEATIKRGYERFMANYNGNYRINRHVSASFGATWQKRNINTSGVKVSDFANLEPYEMLLNDDGSYAYNTSDWFNQQEVENIDASSFPSSDFSYNMLREVRNRNYRTNTDNWRIQLGLNFNIIKGLTYDIKYQYEYNKSSYRYLDSPETYAVRYYENFFTDFDSTTGECVESYLPTGSKLQSGNSTNKNSVLRNQINYKNIFGKHDVSALAGIEISEYKSSSTTNPTVFGYDENTNTAPAPWYGTKSDIKNLYGYSFYNDYYLFNLWQTQFSDRTDRYLSYYLNAAYMYDNRYGVSFSSRWDGSNFVTDDSSLRWSPMWSVGAKWNMKNEKFLKDVADVDYLTLRFTYGLNGNAETSTSTQTLINMSESSVTNTTIARIASYGNPNLSWEVTHSTNFGVDFSFFRNMLSGKFDVYNRMSKDVIGTVNIPAVYGSTSQRFNNAKISNRGFELELTGRFNIDDLHINSTITYAYNKNKVEKLYHPNNECYAYMYADDITSGYFIEGKPIGAVYGYKFAGTEDGVPYVWGPDGTKCSLSDLTLSYDTFGSDDFLEYKGSSISPHTFGWANEFSWKGLSLYVYLTGKFGGYYRTPTAQTPYLDTSGAQFISKYIYRYEESDGSEMPTWPNKGDYMCYRWDRYIPYLSCFIEDASFIRLKELTLSYQLPAVWMSKLKLQGVKVYCQARDLGIIWAANKYDDDPEWLPGTNKPSTSITLGLDVTL